MKKKVMLLSASVMCSMGIALLVLTSFWSLAQSSFASETEAGDDCSEGRCVVYYGLHCIEKSDCATKKPNCGCGTVVNCVCK
jgi:hypothetical protein